MVLLMAIPVLDYGKLPTHKIISRYVTIFKYIKKLVSPNRKPKQAAADFGDATVIARPDHSLSRADISDNTLKVLYRLHNADFQAFLVGGGVRDLLLRRAPKDFDVATDASPEQVRKLFRNCRLIGRRFRLAHILFGREVVEVATFRRQADLAHERNQGSMIKRDNVYGTVIEDAWRRDFTINALYYNIADFSIVDFTGGMQDMADKTIRLIGDPAERYQEDPVRMLRALRFAAKLEFTIAPDTAAPIAKMTDHLDHVSSSRLFDEVLKLFFSGHAAGTFQQLSTHGLFEKLFPQTTACLTEDTTGFAQLITNAMQATDDRIAQDKPVTPGFLLAVLLWQPQQLETERLIQAGMPPLPALEEAMQTVVRRQIERLNIPKRFTRVAKEIWFLQYRLPRRYGRRAYRTLEHPRFRAGYDFLLLRAQIDTSLKPLADWWTQFQSAKPEQREKIIDGLKKPRRRPQRKKS